MILYVCETCRTHMTTIDTARHAGHNMLGIEGDNLDVLQRLALKHFDILRRDFDTGTASL